MLESIEKETGLVVDLITSLLGLPIKITTVT